MPTEAHSFFFLHFNSSLPSACNFILFAFVWNKPQHFLQNKILLLLYMVWCLKWRFFFYYVTPFQLNWSRFIRSRHLMENCPIWIFRWDFTFLSLSYKEITLGEKLFERTGYQKTRRGQISCVYTTVKCDFSTPSRNECRSGARRGSSFSPHTEPLQSWITELEKQLIAPSCWACAKYSLH